MPFFFQIAKIETNLGKLAKSIREQPHLSNQLKLRVFRAIVVEFTDGICPKERKRLITEIGLVRSFDEMETTLLKFQNDAQLLSTEDSHESWKTDRPSSPRRNVANELDWTESECSSEDGEESTEPSEESTEPSEIQNFGGLKVSMQCTLCIFDFQVSV